MAPKHHAKRKAGKTRQKHPALALNSFQFQTLSRKRTSILLTGTSVQIPEKIRTLVRCYREQHLHHVVIGVKQCNATRLGHRPSVAPDSYTNHPSRPHCNYDFDNQYHVLAWLKTQGHPSRDHLQKSTAEHKNYPRHR